MNPVAQRLLNQQLAAPQFSKPEEVVSHLGAMQAQEYRLMRWAVAMRTKNPSASAFKKAFDDGRIVRVHLWRGTWQLVSGEDFWWMMDLGASKAESIIRGWMSANKISLPTGELLQIREYIALAVEEFGSATKEDFANYLSQKGIVMTDQRLSYHLRMSELCGLLCSGDLLPMKATYSLAEKKVGPKSAKDRDESLMLLARKYFQSHAPATLEDFAWWCGLGTGDCKRGMSLLGDELLAETWQGRKFYLLQSCRTRGFKKGSALLLPSYDEYLIGYKSRDISLPHEYSPNAHNNSGTFYPVILHDGIVCGNWSPFCKDFSCKHFFPDDPLLNEASCWEKYQAFWQK